MLCSIIGVGLLGIVPVVPSICCMLYCFVMIIGICMCYICLLFCIYLLFRLICDLV